MLCRQEIGHAPANFAFVTVLTSSFALLAFSKYWRAQIALFPAYTASFASILDFYSSSLHRLSTSTDELRLPSFLPTQHRSLRFWISTVLLFTGFLPVPTGAVWPLSYLYSFLRFGFGFLQFFSSPAFCKYRRAQITLFHIHTASFALALDFYSSSLHRLSASTNELRLISFMPIQLPSLRLWISRVYFICFLQVNTSLEHPGFSPIIQIHYSLIYKLFCIS